MLSEEEYQKRIQELKNKKFTNLYFIHIPKAAGSYVRNFPIPISAHGNHEQFHGHPAHNQGKIVNGTMYSARQLLERGNTVAGYSTLRKDDKKLQNSLKFATVRNPFDYLISCYFSGMVGAPHQIIKCNEDHGSYRTYCNHCNGFGYERFLSEFSRGQILYPPCRKNLFHQIFDNEGRCRVDLLIRSELVIEGLQELSSIISLKDEIKNIPKDHINSSSKRKKRDYRNFYTEEIRQRIQKKVRKELDIFGYTFEGPICNRPFVFLDKDKKYDIF